MRRFHVSKLHLVLAYHHIEVACYALGFLVVGIIHIDAPYRHAGAHILVHFVGVCAYWCVVGHFLVDVNCCLLKRIVILVTVVDGNVALTSVFLRDDGGHDFYPSVLAIAFLHLPCICLRIDDFKVPLHVVLCFLAGCCDEHYFVTFT